MQMTRKFTGLRHTTKTAKIEKLMLFISTVT